MPGFHWNSAADRQAPSGPRPVCVRKTIFVSVTAMHDARRGKADTVFFFFFLVYLPRHRGRDGLRRDEGEKQGRQQRRKRVREEGWDATSSAQSCLRIQKGQTMIYIRAPQLSGFVLSVSISHTSRDRADLSKYNPPFKTDLLPTTKTKHTVYAMKSPV